MTEKKQNIEINNIIKTCLDEIYLLNSDAMSDDGRSITTKFRIDDFGDDSDVKVAKKHNLPVVVISELARDSYKSGQRLSMASFKESGTIEYEGSWLGILAAVEETKDGGYKMKENWEHIIEHDGTVDLIVFKAKRGTGLTGKIPLKIDKNKMTVMDRKDHPDINIAPKIKKTSKFA